MTKFCLDALPSKQSASILGFAQEVQSKNRLLSLGFLPGTAVKVLRNHKTLPLLLELDGTRIALGRSEAKCIFVTEVC